MKALSTHSTLAPLDIGARALAAAALLQACSASVSSTTADGGVASPEDVPSMPQIELYTVNNLIPPEVTVGQVIGAYARVRDGTRTLINQQVRLAVMSGDGNCDSVANGGYSSLQGQDTVTMDHVCVDTTGTTINSTALRIRSLQNGGSFGRVSVQQDPCIAPMVDTGFLVSRFYAPSTEQDTTIRATALSLENRPFAERVIQTRESPVGSGHGEHGISILPINDHIAHGQPFAAMVGALDGTTPIACYMDGLPASTNGESSEESGCNITMNGPREELWRARNAKNIVTYSDAWTINADEASVTNIQLLARGRGNVDTTPLMLTNLGGGMHLVMAQPTAAGRASFSVTLSDNDTRRINATAEITAE